MWTWHVVNKGGAGDYHYVLRVPFIAVFTKDAYTRTISSHSSPASFSPCPFPYQGHPLTFPPDNGGRACAAQLTRIVYALAHKRADFRRGGGLARAPEEGQAHARNGNGKAASVLLCTQEHPRWFSRQTQWGNWSFLLHELYFICLLANFHRETERAVQMTIMVRFRPETMSNNHGPQTTSNCF